VGKERPGRDADPSPPSSAVVKKELSYTSTPPMGRTACTGPQCLYKGALYRKIKKIFQCARSEDLTFSSQILPLLYNYMTSIFKVKKSFIWFIGLCFLSTFSSERGTADPATFRYLSITRGGGETKKDLNLLG